MKKVDVMEVERNNTIVLQEYWSEFISFEDLNRSINTLPPPRKSATVRIFDSKPTSF